MLNETLTNQNTAEWTSSLTGQMLLLGLLGKILLDIPQKEWLQPLIDEEVFAESPFAETQPDVIEGLALLEAWSDRGRGGLSEEVIGELQVDYTRLFSGVSKIPVAPWESVYFNDERLVFQKQTVDVRNWYKRFGLEVASEHNEPDDHIGLELAFMAHLARLGLTAQGENDDGDLQEARSAQREFLQGHLLLWAPLWCNLVLEHARTSFYRGLALLLRGALSEIALLLDL